MRNRAELAEGWYDPDTLRKAQASAAAEDDRPATSRAPLPPARERELGASDRDNDDDASGDEDDGYGPAFPSDSDPHARIARREKPSGPSIPNVQDLQVQRGNDSIPFAISFISSAHETVRDPLTPFPLLLQSRQPSPRPRTANSSATPGSKIADGRRSSSRTSPPVPPQGPRTGNSSAKPSCGPPTRRSRAPRPTPPPGSPRRCRMRT